MNFGASWKKAYDKCVKSWEGGVPPGADDRITLLEKRAVNVVKAFQVVDQYDLDKALKVNNGKGEYWTNEYEGFCKDRTELGHVANDFYLVIDAALKKVSKATHAPVYRELKALKSHLDFLVADVEKHVVKYSPDALKVRGKTDDKIQHLQETTKKLNDKVISENDKILMKNEKIHDNDKKLPLKDNPKIAENKEKINKLRKIQLLQNFPADSKVVLAKCLKCIQDTKANPTPTSYNDYIGGGGSGETGAGRALSQQFINVLLFMDFPECPPTFKQAMNGLEAFRSRLDSFGNGDKRTVNQDADANLILQNVKEFSTLVKEIAIYVPKVSNWLSQNKI